jgi:hypothetical protein
VFTARADPPVPVRRGPRRRRGEPLHRAMIRGYSIGQML